MTIASTVTKKIYDADGVTRDWPITMETSGISATEIKVYLVDEDGVSTLVTANYDVDLTALSVEYPTVVSGLDPIASPNQILLVRELALTQPTDYKNQGDVPAETIEEGLDRLTEVAQQLQEQVDRSVKRDISENSGLDYDDFVAVKADCDAAQAAAELAETNAETAATNAASSASAASSSASSASSSASAASSSASSASSSASAASTSATNAASSASAASTSATNAASSASSASSSASTATTQASNAASSASAASTSASNAASSASAASSSASAASSSASAAASSASAAAASEAAAEAALANFNETYLGAQASDPSVDNNGDPVTAGDWYFNTSSDRCRIYDGAAWDFVAVDVATIVSKTSATGSAVMPTGTTGERDGTPSAGYLRFNTTLGKPEVYNGSAWGSVGGGATGGGGDEVFVENGQTVTANYTLTTGKNAMSVGPVTVNSGVTVTVPSGSRWLVLQEI